jgi:hypothetical protein
MQVIGVVPSDDIEAAAWIGPRLRPFTSYQAGSVIPGGFDAYARIDHERTGALPPEAARRLITILLKHTPAPEVLWLAMWNGYGQMHGPPAMATLTAVRIDADPAEAAPPPPPWPDGWMHPPLRQRNAPLLRLPAREYLLYQGRPDQVAGWMDGPNLWWPADRAWCVASEIDLPWTYVGGSKTVIAEVLGDPELRAQPLSLDESTLAQDHPELGQRP